MNFLFNQKFLKNSTFFLFIFQIDVLSDDHVVRLAAEWLRVL